jgi:probable phosphoglycerate mutase
MPKPVLYYVRHGLTEWNRQQRLQGRHDVPLIAEGRIQATRCGEILRALLARTGRVPGDLVYVSSPLMRARETMELVRAALGLPAAEYDVDARLAEIAFGDW